MSRRCSGEIAAVHPNSDGGSLPSVALVIGATGIVGMTLADTLSLPATPGAPWKVYAVSRRPRAAYLPPSPAHSILCDISVPAEAMTKLSPLADVTHVFYAAWSRHETEAENMTANTAMLRNVLTAVVPSASCLRHVCLQTGRKHYLGNKDSPFHEGMSRLPCLNTYYEQEDVLFESLRNSKVTYSVHRPGVIFGLSVISQANIISTLCVYAAICKREGSLLRWPGRKIGWEGLSSVSDAGLVAEQEIWAAVDPRGKDEAFNCSNGDVFKWKDLWASLADLFGLDAVGYCGEEGRFSLKEVMKGKGRVWEEIVEENGLASTRMEEIATWWIADGVMNIMNEQLDTMNKSKERGFFGFRNTRKAFVSWIVKMRCLKIVP